MSEISPDVMCEIGCANAPSTLMLIGAVPIQVL